MLEICQPFWVGRGTWGFQSTGWAMYSLCMCMAVDTIFCKGIFIISMRKIHFTKASCYVCYLGKSPVVFWQQSRGSSRWENWSAPALLSLREKPALATLSCKINLKSVIPADHLCAQHSQIWPHRTHLSPFSPQKESGIFITNVLWRILVKKVSGFLTLAILQHCSSVKA